MVKKNPKVNSGTRSPKKQSAGNPEAQPATGGELHSIAGGQHQVLTTNQGVALSDNQNSLKANPRGLGLVFEGICFPRLVTVARRVPFGQWTGGGAWLVRIY